MIHQNCSCIWQWQSTILWSLAFSHTTVLYHCFLHRCLFSNSLQLSDHAKSQSVHHTYEIYISYKSFQNVSLAFKFILLFSSKLMITLNVTTWFISPISVCFPHFFSFSFSNSFQCLLTEHYSDSLYLLLITSWHRSCSPHTKGRHYPSSLPFHQVPSPYTFHFLPTSYEFIS